MLRQLPPRKKFSAAISVSCVPGKIPERHSDATGDSNPPALRLHSLKLVCLPFHQYLRWLLIACEVPVAGLKPDFSRRLKWKGGRAAYCT